MSCNKALDKVIQTIYELKNDYNHYDILNSTTKIIIKSEKEQNSIYSKEFEESPKNEEYETLNISQVNDFKKLFENKTKTDYCCCPAENYSISFYKKENNFNYYLVDTIEFKNKIRIYEVGYQYSYLIDKELWKNYLKEINIKK